jgi:hypothetical protein
MIPLLKLLLPLAWALEIWNKENCRRITVNVKQDIMKAADPAIPCPDCFDVQLKHQGEPLCYRNYLVIRAAFPASSGKEKMVTSVRLPKAAETLPGMTAVLMPLIRAIGVPI